MATRRPAGPEGSGGSEREVGSVWEVGSVGAGHLAEQEGARSPPREEDRRWIQRWASG